MKRLLLALTVVLGAAPAYAANTMMVVNHSGLPIDELFAAAPGTKAWSANLMEGVGEGALDNGKAHKVAALSKGTYDLRISAPDEGVLCVMSGVKVAGSKLELTKDMGSKCK